MIPNQGPRAWALLLVFFVLSAALPPPSRAEPAPQSRTEEGLLDRLKASYQGVSSAVTEKMAGIEKAVKTMGEELAAVGRFIKTVTDLVFFVGFKLLTLLTITLLSSMLLSATGLLQGRSAFLVGFGIAAFIFHKLCLALTAGQSGGWSTILYGGIIAALPAALSFGVGAGVRFWHRRRLGRVFSPIDLTSDQGLRKWLFEFEEGASEISRLGHSILAAQPADRAPLQLELAEKVRAALGARAHDSTPGSTGRH